MKNEQASKETTRPLKMTSTVEIARETPVIVTPVFTVATACYSEPIGAMKQQFSCWLSDQGYSNA